MLRRQPVVGQHRPDAGPPRQRRDHRGMGRAASRGNRRRRAARGAPRPPAGAGEPQRRRPRRARASRQPRARRHRAASAACALHPRRGPAATEVSRASRGFSISRSQRSSATSCQRHQPPRRRSIASQIFAVALIPSKRSSSCSPVGEVTLISVSQSPITSMPTKIWPFSRSSGPIAAQISRSRVGQPDLLRAAAGVHVRPGLALRAARG